MSKTIQDIISRYGSDSFCSVTVKKEKSATGHAGTLTELTKKSGLFERPCRGRCSKKFRRRRARRSAFIHSD